MHVDTEAIQRARSAVAQARQEFETSKASKNCREYDAKFQAVIVALARYNLLRSQVIDSLDLGIL